MMPSGLSGRLRGPLAIRFPIPDFRSRFLTGARIKGVGALMDETPGDPVRLTVAIERPDGPVVENLLSAGIPVWAINPEQVDRFRVIGTATPGPRVIVVMP